MAMLRTRPAQNAIAPMHSALRHNEDTARRYTRMFSRGASENMGCEKSMCLLPRITASANSGRNTSGMR